MHPNSANFPHLSPPGDPSDPLLAGGTYRPKGWRSLAWLVIIAGCIAAVLSHVLDTRTTSSTASTEDRLGIMLMELQGKYLVGAAAQMGNNPMLYTSAKDSLNLGTPAQRLRFIVLASELAGPDEAFAQLEQFESLLAAQNAVAARKVELTPEQLQIVAILKRLYAPTAESSPPQPLVDRVAQTTADDRSILVDELGWFGELALAPSGGNPVAREQTLWPAKRLVQAIVTGVVLFVFAGVIGSIALIWAAILAFTGRLRSRVRATHVHDGIYAETFALWMLLFLGLQFAAAYASTFWPDGALLITFIAFFMSLASLAWPVLRGVPWSAVKEDIGWHPGSAPALEPLVGILGYLMMLPVLVVGVLITLVLIAVQGFFKAPGPMFEPDSGPAHPIIEQLTGPDWFPKIMVLLLGAVAAPIVEETMFRGVLYRHLRSFSANLGIGISVLLSTIINSFVFAIIHPQGWVAVPALMSLAIMFSLVREWRGTVIPSMVMHGVSNFLVLSLLTGALRL